MFIFALVCYNKWQISSVPNCNRDGLYLNVITWELQVCASNSFIIESSTNVNVTSFHEKLINFPKSSNWLHLCSPDLAFMKTFFVNWKILTEIWKHKWSPTQYTAIRLSIPVSDVVLNYLIGRKFHTSFHTFCCIACFMRATHSETEEKW